MSDGYVILVEFEVAAADLAAFLTLVRDNAAASVREEPGCRRFDVLTPQPPGGRVTLYEIYADRPAFEAHLATPHYAAFDAATRGLVRDKLVRGFELDEHAA